MRTDLRRAALALAVAALSACGGDEEAAPAAAPVAADAEAQAPKPAAVAPKKKKRVAVIDSTYGGEVRRESFEYAGGGRDPFKSLLAEATMGPDVNDLQLVAIYADLADPKASVAVLRDRVTSRRYKVHAGDRLGSRVRVAEVRLKDVVFRIDEFGATRTQALSLRKQEDELP